MKHLLLAAVIFSGAALAGKSAPTLNIDPDRMTVSGISAGAHMAHQLHIAYSELFSGAALIAGGPFNCAGNSMITAMGRCMANSDDVLPVAEMTADIRTAAERGELADPANLANDRVWLFHGTRDSTISAEVHNAAGTLYAEFMPAEQIRRVNDVPAGHFFPARGRGHDCTELQPPFVGNCDYDAAGELLSFLYTGLKAPESQAVNGLQEVTLPGADDADLLETAYLFIPPACAGGEKTCALHLVLHGCGQSAETVGTAFIEQSGYIPWARTNDIVLAFPQVEKSLVSPLNPHACWDWWGYTGDNYLWRSSKQMTVLTDWIGQLRSASVNDH